MGLRWLCIAVLALVLPLAASASEQELGEAKVVAKIETDFKPCSEAAGFGYLWVANYGAGSLSRIDPATNTVTGTPYASGSSASHAGWGSEPALCGSPGTVKRRSCASTR